MKLENYQVVRGLEDSYCMSRRELVEKIEETREHMIRLGLEEGLVSNNTIVVSQILDQLLNKLDKISLEH
ncbi:aspartyl-phosphate phosphatase Spo0E family protein [Priestia koreensis]|uniref:Spo0E like sporulation regulatory protein n=2 Tax=Priestia koreensis TaxID=284581 RepID=A0A0M0LC36_9BACI|nr:hypothetical protein AMD01_04425 [Priestia koreensis]